MREFLFGDNISRTCRTRRGVPVAAWFRTNLVMSTYFIVDRKHSRDFQVGLAVEVARQR
jgi:hypothetical protein